MDQQITYLMQDSKLRKAFGARVKQLRKQHHWTQKALARKVEIRFQLLNKYEGGQHIPSVETLIRLADALGTSVDYLLTGNPVEDSPLASSRLFQRFRTLEGLHKEEQDAVITLIDAMIAKHKMEAALTPVDQAISG